MGVVAAAAQRSLFGDEFILPAKRVREPPRAVVFTPHPEGPVLPREESGLDDLNRLSSLKTWVWERRWPAAYPEAVEAAALRGCPNRLPILVLAWLLLRRCPVCGRRIKPDESSAVDTLEGLALQHFCGDACSRYRDDLTAPTQEQIRERAEGLQSRWSLAERLDHIRGVGSGLKAIIDLVGEGEEDD